MTKPRAKSAPVDELTLPHNLEAERAVIGAVLLGNDGYHTAARYIRHADFFRDAHRRIYHSIERLLDQPHGVVDFLTLKEDLAKHGDLEEAGGPAYVASLIDGVPRSANIAHYARIVKDKSLLRQIIAHGQALVTDAYIGEEGADALLLRADKTFVEMQHGHSHGRMRALNASIGELGEDLEFRHAHRGELTGIDTGFASLNQMTLGWQNGDLILVAARPSIGKTSFVVNGCAVAAARQGKRVAVFSMEMRRRQLEYRILSSISGVPLSTLLGGFTSESHEWMGVTQATGEMAALPIHIDDSAGHTAWSIRAACRRLRAEGGLDLGIIDYIQLMGSSLDRRGANRNEEITDTSRKLKVLADELGIPLIVLSQLSRAGEGRSDPRPKLSDLRESGALEQDADLVVFLHRKHHRESGVTNLILEKARNGPTGTLNLTINRETTTFFDGGEEPAPTEAEIAAEKHDAKVKAIIRHRKRG